MHRFILGYKTKNIASKLEFPTSAYGSFDYFNFFAIQALPTCMMSGRHRVFTGETAFQLFALQAILIDVMPRLIKLSGKNGGIYK